MRWRDKIFPKVEQFEDYDFDPSEKLPARALPFVWYFVRRIKWAVLFVFLTYTAGAIAIALAPVFFGWLVKALSVQGAVNWQVVWLIVGLYIFVTQIIARTGFQLGHMGEATFQPVMTMMVRRRLSLYLHKHSYRYFQDDFAGRLSGKVVEMPQSVHEILVDALNPLQYSTVNALTALTVFCFIDWRFVVIALVYFAATYLLARWGVPRVSAAARDVAEAMHEMRGRFTDSVANILLVKLFARRRYEDSYFSDSLRKHGHKWVNEGWQFVYYWRGQHVLNALFQIALIVYCVYGYRSGVIDVPQIVVVLPTGAALTSNMWWLLHTMSLFFARFATVQEALDTVIRKQEVLDKEGAAALAVKTPDIAFDHVKFSYPGRPVFADLTLEIPARQKIGLVGPSGAGKSTLLQLLLRLFDVQDGQIKIGGTDIAAVTQDSLREQIAMIPQSSDLLHRSVYENIRYGRLDATREDVIEAAKKAHIHDVILDLQDQHGNKGYDAIVGERGVKLSGGQRQRVAIARAILKDAPILVLDEATSALDSESECAIQASLKYLMEGKTVIAIAHRLSTIAHLDRLIVMEEGAIIEDGTHKQLLRRKGLYHKLWGMQSDGFIGDADEADELDETEEADVRAGEAF